jgi:biotin transport system substrate-specific component
LKRFKGAEMSITSQATLRGAVFARPTALTQTALVLGGTAFLAAMAQISIPVPGSPVPVTGQTLGALLLASAYGAGLGLTTFATYLLVGIAGAPIFASGTHGWARLAGATGGYLVGMLLATALTGWLASRKWDRKLQTSVITMLAGEVIIFASGLIWLEHAMGESLSKLLAMGFTPFIFGEALKIAIASTSLPLIWKFLPTRAKN